MDQFTELLKEINIAQIFVILGGKIGKLEDKVEKLSDKVDDVDRRLCRIEGSLATQGHCLIAHTQHQERKVE